MHRDPFAGVDVISPRSGSAGGASPSTKRSLIAEKMYRDLKKDPNFAAEAKQSRRTAGRANGIPNQASRPKFLVCYLCGQQFGTTSLRIHQPQCYVKKLLVWEKGDYATRGPKPQSPEEHEEAMSARGIDAATVNTTQSSAVDAYNDAQFQEFQDKALVPCENCGRTFLPDRLQVHLRSCKPGQAAKRPATRRAGGTSDANESSMSNNENSMSGSAPPPPARAKSPAIRPASARATSPAAGKARAPAVASRFKEALKPENMPRCQFCNRTFAADRIEKHESVCQEAKKAPSARKIVSGSPKGAAPASSPAKKRPVTPRGSTAPRAASVQDEQSEDAVEFRRRVEAMMAETSSRSGSGSAIEAPLKRDSPKQQLASPPPRSGPSATKSTPPPSPAKLSSTARPSSSTAARDALISPPHPDGVLSGKTSPQPEAVVTPRLKFCIECGAKFMKDNQKFCAECGASVAVMMKSS